MRAKYINENHIGDRKKHLASGDIFTVTNINNLNGGGDLFIKNENTGAEEKCYSNDWNNMRKYSSIILESDMEFTQGADPYKQLKIGKYKQFTIGDKIIFLEKLGKSSMDYWIKANYFFQIRDYTLFIVSKIDKNIITIKSHNKQEYFHFPISWFADNPTLWKQIFGNIDESINFEQGGDPYKKLNVGKFQDPKYLEQRETDIYIIENLKRMVYKLSTYGNQDAPSPYGGNQTIAQIKKEFEYKIKELSAKHNLTESLDFKQGGDPYQKLKIGQYSELFTQCLNFAKDIKYVETSEVFYDDLSGTDAFTMLHRHEKLIVYKYSNEVEVGIFLSYKNGKAEWDHLGFASTIAEFKKLAGLDLNESLDFKQGGDPYQKLKIGHHSQYDVAYAPKVFVDDIDNYFGVVVPSEFMNTNHYMYGKLIIEKGVYKGVTWDMYSIKTETDKQKVKVIEKYIKDNIETLLSKYKYKLP